jgi:hypothetical protein
LTDKGYCAIFPAKFTYKINGVRHVEFYYSDVHRFFFNRFFLGDVLFISFYLKQLENKDFFKSLVIILSWGFFIDDSLVL